MTAGKNGHRWSPISTAIPESWTRPQRIFFFFTLAAGLAWSAFVLLASPGWSLDDELAHYMRSRSVWENPALIFDSWTRIGRNLFHVLPAHYGLTAARFWTLAFAGLAVVLTTMLAGRMGVRRTWLVPLALCFQPWFAELSWGVLTETPFMLALVGGILALGSGRQILSGFCFGMLPLIRHEGIALTGLWVAALAIRTLLNRRDPRMPLVAILSSAIPMALYNLASWLCLGDFPSRVLFSPKPTEIYGHGTPWHFFSVSLEPAGVFTVILCGLGLPLLLREWKVTWLLVFYPAYFALHTLIYWKGLFSSAGYYHFLMPMAPGLAIAAIFGADTLLDHGSVFARRTAFLLLGGSALQGLLMVHLWHGPHPQVTLHRDSIDGALDSALDWQKSERPHATAVICRHVYASFREDWLETPARQILTLKNPSELPPGSVVIWDEKYSDLNGMPLAALQTGAGWHESADFGSGSVKVFEKIR